MENEFMPQILAQFNLVAINKVLDCNKFSSGFGLSLTEDEVKALAEHRLETLKATGRIELSGWIMPKLIFAFCDSPFIYQDNYEEMLFGLQEVFYYFKGEMLEQISDDELIAVMKDKFDTECQGSLEYLQETVLEEIARSVREDENE